MKKPRKMKSPTKHTRVIDTFTGKLERRLLRWIAARLPAWVVPDHLTWLSLAASAVTCVSFVLSAKNPVFLWVAAAGFVVNWFGDSLDGTLARVRQIERPRYGFFIDHSVDAVSTVLVFLGIGYSSYVRFDIAVFALIGYLLLSLYAALSTYAASEFKISYAYLGPTEIRLLAILCSIYTFFNPSRFINLLIGNFSFFELIMMGLILLFYSAFLLSSIGLLVKLGRMEPAKNTRE